MFTSIAADWNLPLRSRSSTNWRRRQPGDRRLEPEPAPVGGHRLGDGHRRRVRRGVRRDELHDERLLRARRGPATGEPLPAGGLEVGRRPLEVEPDRPCWPCRRTPTTTAGSASPPGSRRRRRRGPDEPLAVDRRQQPVAQRWQRNSVVAGTQVERDRGQRRPRVAQDATAREERRAGRRARAAARMRRRGRPPGRRRRGPAASGKNDIWIPGSCRLIAGRLLARRRRARVGAGLAEAAGGIRRGRRLLADGVRRRGRAAGGGSAVASAGLADGRRAGRRSGSRTSPAPASRAPRPGSGPRWPGRAWPTRRSTTSARTVPSRPAGG